MKQYLLIATLFCMLGYGLTVDIPQAVAMDKAYWQEFTKQKVMYKSWPHFWFSVWGYRNPTIADAKRSRDEQWWGTPIKVKK